MQRRYGIPRSGGTNWHTNEASPSGRGGAQSATERAFTGCALSPASRELSQGESLWKNLGRKPTSFAQGATPFFSRKTAFFESLSFFSRFLQKFYFFAELFRFSAVYDIRNMICEKGGVSQTESFRLVLISLEEAFLPFEFPYPAPFSKAYQKAWGL